jgi:hypothetical protein
LFRALRHDLQDIREDLQQDVQQDVQQGLQGHASRRRRTPAVLARHLAPSLKNLAIPPLFVVFALVAAQ